MEYMWIAVVVLLTYLIYKLFIKPITMKAYYSKIFKAQGYKVFQYPYSVLSAPFFEHLMEDQKTKNDFNYTGKHVYSDSYDVVISNVFNKPELVFLNEKLIKGYFDKNVQMKVPKMNTGFDIFCFIIKKGIPFLQKKTWKHRRALLSRVFNFDFIISHIPTMIHSANLISQTFQEEYWQKNPQKRAQKEIRISLYEWTEKYTSNIVMAGFLDSMKAKLRGKTIQQQILKLTDQSIVLSRDLLNLMFGDKFLQLGLRKKDRQLLAFNQEINQCLRAYINNYRLKRSMKRISDGSRQTVIQLILQEIEKEQNNEKGQLLITDDDLIDEIKTFVIAGTDTTSNYLTMVLLYIYEHKEVLQKLRKEIEKHIKSDEDITYENVKKISYLDCVLSESSRLFNTSESGYQRIFQEDSSLCDIPMLKGTCINIYITPVVSSSKNFKDPLSFKPERWQKETDETKRLQQLVSYQFFGGPHACIGKHLALAETKVAVITFLRRYKSLIEPGLKNRAFAFQLTAHLVNSEVILEKYQ